MPTFQYTVGGNGIGGLQGGNFPQPTSPVPQMTDVTIAFVLNDSATSYAAHGLNKGDILSNSAGSAAWGWAKISTAAKNNLNDCSSFSWVPATNVNGAYTGKALFRGVDRYDAIGAKNNNSGNSATISAAAITSTKRNSLAVAVLCVHASNQTIPLPSGWTNIDTFTYLGGSIRMCYQNLGEVGSQSSPISVSITSTNWKSFVFELCDKDTSTPWDGPYFVDTRGSENASATDTYTFASVFDFNSVQAGDLLIAMISVANNPPPASMSVTGDTWQMLHYGNEGTLAGRGIAWMIASSTTYTKPTFNWSIGSAKQIYGNIVQIRNVDQKNPFDSQYKYDVDQTATQTTWNITNPVKTSRPNSLGIGILDTYAGNADGGAWQQGGANWRCESGCVIGSTALNPHYQSFRAPSGGTLVDSFSVEWMQAQRIRSYFTVIRPPPFGIKYNYNVGINLTT